MLTFVVLQATVRLHSCCMMTCTLNGGPELSSDGRDMEAARRMPGNRGGRRGHCVPGQPASISIKQYTLHSLPNTSKCGNESRLIYHTEARIGFGSNKRFTALSAWN